MGLYDALLQMPTRQAAPQQSPSGSLDALSPQMQAINQLISQRRQSAFFDGLLKAGQPSPYKIGLGQAFGMGAGAADQASAPLQDELLKSRINALTPKYEVTKDAFGNPIAYNSLDPSKTMPIGKPLDFGGGSGGGEGQATATGDDSLKYVPSNFRSLIPKIANGELTIQQAMGANRNPELRASLLDAVVRYDPKFDAVDYNARSKTRNDFTSGKSAQNITALNTAIGHIDSLMGNADALNNTSYPSVNAVTNWLDTQMGGSGVKNFNTTKDAVADELTRVFRGTGGSVSDIDSWKEKLSAANSPEQFKGVAKQMAELLGSRLDALGAQYNQGMGTSKEGIDLLTPKAQQSYRNLSGEAPPRTNAGGQKTAQGDRPKVQLPPANAIAFLRTNPNQAKAFEQKYGISASKFLVGGAGGQY